MGVHKDQKTGNYYIRVKYYGREFEKVIGKDKRSAEIALSEVKNEIRIAKLAGQGWNGFAKLQKAQRPKLFKEAAREYMDERVHFKASSLAQYTSILNCYLLPSFGTNVMSSIDETAVRKFQAKLQQSGISESRVNTVMQLLRSILGQAYRKGELARDPSLAVRRVPESKAKINPLSEDELRKVLDAIDPHYKPLFVCLAFSGARPNELQALRWSDLNWNNETISITKGRVRGKEGRPKTTSSERFIPMTPPVKAALQELKERRVASIDYVFTNKKSQPIDKHLDRIWERALRKARLAHRPSYQLRHTFITQCIIKGLPLPYIAKLVGHSTIDTLVRHYAGWVESATLDNDEKLKNCFGKSQNDLSTNDKAQSP